MGTVTAQCMCCSAVSTQCMMLHLVSERLEVFNHFSDLLAGLLVVFKDLIISQTSKHTMRNLDKPQCYSSRDIANIMFLYPHLPSTLQSLEYDLLIPKNPPYIALIQSLHRFWKLLSKLCFLLWPFVHPTAL